ncbi:ferrous iron transport protein B [Nafulsella turpanensis]|uniref:ferrous iron transport protein B n=1 Tax=Nafulsella turpanensis TaxID=1265690 RepID=UPI000345C429|nr:ferrous iron transport protein B [Nafulsella turpanensis]
MSTVTQIKPQLQLVALAGIPNVGKSTIFNHLTDLNQKIGNYPGVTVDKKTGTVRLGSDQKLSVVDLPGTYSLFPRSEDERVVYQVLCGQEKNTQPDAVLAIADMGNMERSLFFVSQLIDLGIPLTLVLNMEDAAVQKGISVNTYKLYQELGVPVIVASARNRQGLEAVKEAMKENTFTVAPPFLDTDDLVSAELIQEIKELFGYSHDYQALHVLKFADEPELLGKDQSLLLQALIEKHSLDVARMQAQETTLRYDKIQDIIKQVVSRKSVKPKSVTKKLDKVLLHPVGGYLLFLGILLLIFQAIFSWASVPMDLIDLLFVNTASWLQEVLPAGALTSLLTEGIIPGIGGIVIFVPQIALLFGFLAILEDTGYMSRAVFLTDKLMRPFGLNGKSVVPLISGMACAIPAIMAARNIGNTKDRLITIMVVPLMSCSARLPVYVILIGVVVPDAYYGIFHLQAVALMGMYLLGIVAALLSALLMKGFIRVKNKGYLVVELPLYQVPRWRNVGLTMLEKSKTFVMEAGKIILAISVVLWVMASYGPGDNIAEAVASVPVPEVQTEAAMEEYRNVVLSKELEASYAGIIGKAIEPIIEPLGYDWKIGIALVTSFAAREVFVSTIATLYSIGENPEEQMTIQERLKAEIRPDGQAMYTTAVGWSLLVFYAFAMQCMSTIAVVHRETKGWKWPLIQTAYLTGLAYISAFIVYQTLS